VFIFDSKQITKFENLDFAPLEFAACSPRSSAFLRKYSLTDGRRIESSTKHQNPFQVWRRGSREKNKIRLSPQLCVTAPYVEYHATMELYSDKFHIDIPNVV
jgi:hypothetical protein